MVVELVDGWRQVGQNGGCSIATLSFVVSCANKYDKEGSSCKLHDHAQRELILGLCVGMSTFLQTFASDTSSSTVLFTHRCVLCAEPALCHALCTQELGKVQAPDQILRAK